MNFIRSNCWLAAGLASGCLFGCARMPVGPILPSAAATNRVVSEKLLARIELAPSGFHWQSPNEIPPRLLPSQTLLASPDSRHFICLKRASGKYVVVVDGTNQASFDWVRYPRTAFTPDSRHWGCAGKRGQKFYALVDGQETELPDYDQHSEVNQSISISSDARRIAYPGKKNGKVFWVVDGQPGKQCEQISRIQFSPDGQHFVYSALEGGREVVVQDRQEPQSYDFLEGIRFGPNSKRLALVAGEGERPHERVASMIWRGVEFGMSVVALTPGAGQSVIYLSDKGKRCVVVDGQESKRYDAIVGLRFSPDGEHVAYKALRDQKCFVVLDGIELQPFDFFPRNPLAFSADSKHLAYIGGRAGKLICAIDEQGTELPLDANVDTPVFSEQFRKVVTRAQAGQTGLVDGPVLSPDGQHLALVVREGKLFYLMLDGQKGKPYYAADTVRWPGTFEVSLSFSPDGKHVAYWAQGANYTWKSVVLDGQEGKLWQQILGQIVFDSNEQVHYLAAETFPDAVNIYLVEERVP